VAKGPHALIQPVTIETVDAAVHAWFDRTVDAHVEHPSGDRRKVPVVFAAGERAFASRQRGWVRDKNGVLILPVISVRRSGMDPDQTMQALGAETPTLTFSRRVSGKTSNLMNLNVSRGPSNRVPDPVVYEVTSVPFPDRSVMTYELTVQAQYMTQMNSILEKVVHQLDLQKSFVAPFDNSGRQPHTGEPFERRPPLRGGYVVGFLDSALADAGNLEEYSDQERAVKWTTTVRVPTTLQLDPEGTRPAVRTERTSYRVGFGDETVRFVDDPEELELIFGNGKVRES
jgi:hypothetical protein